MSELAEPHLPARRPMGEDKRLFLSPGHGAEREGQHSGGVGARLLRGRQAKRNTGRAAGAGDSDGTMGSGGESDSSEEIHYGPGFVSRLKSRYMSVALRGSARGSIGTLRRTASLEDFLEIDKNRAEEEVELLLPSAPLPQLSKRVAVPVQLQAVPSTAAKVRPVVTAGRLAPNGWVASRNILNRHSHILSIKSSLACFSQLLVLSKMTPLKHPWDLQRTCDQLIAISSLLRVGSFNH